MPSRFDMPDPLDRIPGLATKVSRAIRSHSGTSVCLTQQEADFLIAEGGGPDPDYPIPQQLYVAKTGALVVKGGDTPRCWRL